MKLAALLLLFVTSTFAAKWQVDYQIGTGFTPPSSGHETIKKMGFGQFENPLVGAQLKVSRLQYPNRVSLAWSLLAGTLEKEAFETRRGYSGDFFSVGMLMGFQKSVLEGKPMCLYPLIEVGIAGFEIGASLSDVEPGRYVSRSAIGNIGIESEYPVELRGNWKLLLGGSAKAGFIYSYEEDEIFLPQAYLGIKTGFEIGKFGWLP